MIPDSTRAALGIGPATGETWGRDFCPKILPPQWELAMEGDDGVAYRQKQTGMTVILSGATEQDGRRWLHLSCAMPKKVGRLPSWEQLREAKDLFLGKDKLAVQVLPPADRHINIHDFCLHLWCCLDGDPVPDFAKGGRSI